jgi:hypothetical protein
MKKYKLLKFGRCYINREGDFAIGLLGGDKRLGYQFAGTHVHCKVILGRFWLDSRVVPNDGNWIEISPKIFNVASTLHTTGWVLKFPLGNAKGEVPIVTKKYC